MKLRIISDIHTDINQDKNYQFNFGDDFVVNCGDIVGDIITTATWVRIFMKRGIFVEGNHWRYNQITYDSGDTKQESTKYLKKYFKNGDIRFLENSTYIMDEIVFAGATYNDTIDGGSGNDKIYGGAGNDSILGGSGKDYIDGGEGRNTLIEGSGVDTYIANSNDVIFDTDGYGSVSLKTAKPVLQALRSSIISVQSWEKNQKIAA